MENYQQETNVVIKMGKIKLTSDTPSYLKVSEIKNELYTFEHIIGDKYSGLTFALAFCFRALSTTRGINSKVRFNKEHNWLAMDLIMPEDDFKPYKNNLSMQRRIMGKHFFPFFAENIKKYKSKLPTLKPVAEKLTEDMRLFLINNLWLPDETGNLNLSIIEKVPFERAMSLFGNPKQKKFTTNDDNIKVQALTWVVQEDIKLHAKYNLVDKKWLFQEYKVE